MMVLSHVARKSPAGNDLDQFESSFAQIVGAQHAVALDSAGSALRLALEAVGVGKGDEVITSPYNSCAVAEAICAVGAQPVFVDVEQYSLNLNARLIAAAVSKRTKAILAAHTAGLPSDMPSIHQIAGLHNLRVIEDASYAFPSEYRGKMAGGESDVTCYGFHGSGILCTKNLDWAERCRASHHRLSNTAAIVALAELLSVELMWARRTLISRKYNRAFADLPGLQIPADRFDCEHAWHLYMLRLNLDRLKIGRDQFVKELEKRNVQAEVHFVPLHLYSHYCAGRDQKAEDLPVAYREYLREVSLPIHENMTDGEVQRVIDAVIETVHQHRH